MIDANTGKVLHEQFADQPRHPASLTKMMTLYMVFSEIGAGRLAYDTKIKISEKAAGVAPSKLDLEPGEEIEVIDAIKALITKSANDIAVALAEHIGGTEYQFVQMMNDRARQIGMGSSRFMNASGLPDLRQVTTARDMCTLALRLQDDFPKLYRLFSLKSFDYRGKTYRTHNTLMHGFPGMDGIKTGYTKASGFNLVSSVHVENKHLVAAVFGGKTAAARNAHMRVLLYAALQKASTERTRAPQAVAALPARDQAPPEPAATEVAWATETKEAPKIKVVKTRTVPAPAPAARPQKKDAIANVIAKADAAAQPVRVADVAQSAEAAPPAPVTTSAVAPVAASAPPRLDLVALREAMVTEAQAAEAPAAPPIQASASAGPQDINALIRRSLVEPQPPAPAASPAAPTADAARAPSTLNAQAAALGTGAPAASKPLEIAQTPPTPVVSPPPSHLKGPLPVAHFPSAPLGKGFEIQIGAYGTAEEANAKISLVRTRASGLLDGHGSVALPVQRSDRQVFRARFVSFNEEAASSACLELRRLAIDCFVMKAE